jgi:phosphatidylinositol-3-phosphatase
MALPCSGIFSNIAHIGTVRLLGPLLAALLATACQPAVQSNSGSSPASGSRASASPSPRPTPSAIPSPTPAPKHVFLIVLENTSYQLALRQPYIAGLAQQYAVATNYSAVASPSLPNYLAMTSGSTWGIRDDAFHQLPAGGLGSELTSAGISWKAYMEGFTGDCFHSPYPYALKHNPFPYYGGACPANVVPMTDLAPDLNGVTPQLSWITPGLCNDGHDCGVATADKWLSRMVPQITGSPAWQQDGVLLITWDESSAADTRVALLVVAPSFHGQISTPLDHFSLLATISDELGVPRLGLAKQATSLKDQLQAGTA